MIELTVEVSPELQRPALLRERYVLARQKHLVPAARAGIELAKAAAEGHVPVGVSGQARRLLMTRVIAQPGSITAKVESAMRRPNVYFFVMNAGRRPGQARPDSRKLVTWVIAKGLSGEPHRVAFLVARSIAKKGTKPWRAMSQGLYQTKPAIDQLHRQAVDRMVEELNLGR